ncbi:MAG: hypothetical protein JXR19_10195 [Bacteroidia bacterium]
MRKPILLSFLILFNLSVFAQWSFGLFAEPNAQLSYLKETGTAQNDSIGALLNHDKRLSFGVEISLEKDKLNSFHFKPGFYQYGFMLERTGLQLFDVVHSSFGQIYDQSEAAVKVAYMQHRLKYLGLQMEYHRDISPQLKNIGIKLYTGFGLSYYALIDHDIRLRTEGFAIQDDFIHKISSDLFFTPNEHLVSAQALFGIIYEPTSSIDLYAQLQAKAPLMRLTSAPELIYTWMPGLNLGIRKTI